MPSWDYFRNHPFRRMENLKFLAYVVFPIGVVIFMMSRTGLNAVIDRFPLVVYPPEDKETRALVHRERAWQSERRKEKLLADVERPIKVSSSPEPPR